MAPDGKGGQEEKWISKGKVPTNKRVTGERQKESKLNVQGSGVKTISAADALSQFPAHQQTTIAEVEEL
jgi:hypothetical protein